MNQYKFSKCFDGTNDEGFDYEFSDPFSGYPYVFSDKYDGSVNYSPDTQKLISEASEERLNLDVILTKPKKEMAEKRINFIYLTEYKPIEIILTKPIIEEDFYLVKGSTSIDKYTEIMYITFLQRPNDDIINYPIPDNVCERSIQPVQTFSVLDVLPNPEIKGDVLQPIKVSLPLKEEVPAQKTPKKHKMINLENSFGIETLIDVFSKDNKCDCCSKKAQKLEQCVKGCFNQVCTRCRTKSGMCMSCSSFTWKNFADDYNNISEDKLNLLYMYATDKNLSPLNLSYGECLMSISTLDKNYPESTLLIFVNDKKQICVEQEWKQNLNSIYRSLIVKTESDPLFPNNLKFNGHRNGIPVFSVTYASPKIQEPQKDITQEEIAAFFTQFTEKNTKPVKGNILFSSFQ